MSADDPDGAGTVADRRWDRVREIAVDIARLEALDRADGLDADGRIELARLRILAERASTRAMLADELADRIDEVERTRDHRGGAAGT
ncbi:MAG: hypothetical protein FJW99_07140 [Actinobacteria bacterium]|nr:hypothetical protein [Actinomycetota bacterium]MBM3697110.1 hypothetical protein [Actinomycetota bacterium]